MDVTINVNTEPNEDDMEVCPICGSDDMQSGHCDNCGYDTSGNDVDDHMEMSSKTRNALPDSDFLYVSGDTRMFPVQDLKHIRLAIQMLPKAKLSPEIKAKIKAKLRRLAKQHGIDMSEDNSTKPNVLEDITTGKIELSEKQSDGFHRAKFLVTTLNSRNLNGRIYTKDALSREIEHQPNGSVLGQDGHPTSNRKFTEQFLIWEKLMLENDKEYAIAKVVPTIPHGTNFILLAQAGAMASCSRVGTGSVKEGVVNGVRGQVVQSDYQLRHIDIIVPNEQSDQNATMLHFEMYQGDGKNTESVENNMPDNEQPQAVVPTDEQVIEQTTSSAQATVVAETQTPAPAVEAPAKPQVVDAPLPTDIIESLANEIREKDHQISKLTVVATDLASKHAVQAKQISVMNETFAALNAELLRVEKLVSELNNTVQDRSKLIAERDAMLMKRNQALAERQALLEQAHATIQERDTTIAERNRIIAQRNSLLAARDQTIAERDRELVERNSVIAKQDLMIQERDAQIAERDQIIAEERKTLAQRDAIIAESDKNSVERNAQILALNEELLAEKVKVDEEKKRNAALRHLFEKVQVQGDKASWYIFNDLINCASPEEVEEKFEASKARGIALIEGIAVKASKAILKDTTPTDADDLPKPETNKKPKTKTRPALEPDLEQRASLIARFGGI
jgi:hypothetical protein